MIVLCNVLWDYHISKCNQALPTERWLHPPITHRTDSQKCSYKCSFKKLAIVLWMDNNYYLTWQQILCAADNILVQVPTFSAPNNPLAIWSVKVFPVPGSWLYRHAAGHPPHNLAYFHTAGAIEIMQDESLWLNHFYKQSMLVGKQHKISYGGDNCNRLYLLSIWLYIYCRNGNSTL